MPTVTAEKTVLVPGTDKTVEIKDDIFHKLALGMLSMIYYNVHAVNSYGRSYDCCQVLEAAKGFVAMQRGERRGWKASLQLLRTHMQREFVWG